MINKHTRHAAVTSGRFVGRAMELRCVSRVLDAGETLWITGPPGIGKSRLVSEAIGERSAIRLDGHFMATFADALPYLQDVFGTSPDVTRADGIATWLSSALATAATHAEVLIFDDLHLVVRVLANAFLRILRRTAPGYPVLVVGRDSWGTSELVGDHLHHLLLEELSDADAQSLAAAYARTTAELPPAAMGHPLLMHLYFRDGARAVEGWTDSLLGELAAHGPVLRRLAIAHTPTQMRWARQGSSEAELERLRQKGIVRRGCGMLRLIEDAVRRTMEGDGQGDALEHELLDYLAKQATLSERDVVRALQLAIAHARNDVLATLLGRDASASAMTQAEILRVLRNRHIPARIKLGTFQALAEHITLISVEDFLQVHDDLIASTDVLERRVAQISLLRAAFISGHRVWPAEATRYLHEILQCPLLPSGTKEQILHLWAFRAMHARRHSDDLQPAFELLAQSGMNAPTLRAYRLLFAGVDLAAQYRLGKAVEALRESAAAFAACGHRLHVEWVQRYLMGLYYSCWQPAEFRAQLGQIDASSRGSGRGDFRLQFFRVVDAWNRGDSAALEEESAGASLVVPRHAHALLPGPSLIDCQPRCFRVIADRAHDAPVAPDVVDLFVDMLHRMMLSIPVTIASVCLAQHAWLAADHRSLVRLCAALQALGSIGETHALLLRGFLNVATDLVEADQALDLLDRAWLLREPLTTPYYVVIAARVLHEHGIGTPHAVDRLRNHPRAAELPVRAHWVIEAAALALGAEPLVALPPEDVCRAVAAQVHGARENRTQAALSMDAQVNALKQLIDHQWFEAMSLDTFARTHHLSRFAISRRFKTALGRSPRQYLQEMRIHQAKRKLVETDWSVTVIAFECGFADAAQFSRLFKRATGMTPVGYRESMTASIHDS